MRVVWSARAQADLADIAAFIAQDSGAAARRQVALLKAAALGLLRHPMLGRIVPEFEQPHLRERVVGSYRLIYRPGPDVIRVVAVFEGHRQLLLPEDLE